MKPKLIKSEKAYNEACWEPDVGKAVYAEF